MDKNEEDGASSVFFWFQSLCAPRLFIERLIIIEFGRSTFPAA